MTKVLNLTMQAINAGIAETFSCKSQQIPYRSSCRSDLNRGRCWVRVLSAATTTRGAITTTEPVNVALMLTEVINWMYITLAILGALILFALFVSLPNGSKEKA